MSIPTPKLADNTFLARAKQKPAARLYDADEDGNDGDFLPSDQFFADVQVVEAMPAAHWHDHVEFNYLSSGSMTYLFNGNRITLQSGQPYCFWASVPHQVVLAEDDTHLICAYVPFTAFLGLAIPDAFKRELLNGSMMTGRVAEPIDRLLFERWAAEWNSAPDDGRTQILKEETLLRLRRLALDGVPVAIEDRTGLKVGDADTKIGRTKADERLIDRVQQMTNYINQEFANDIQLADIAKVCGLHPSNATAAFRRVLGVTISQYLRRQRLSRAMRMLADTDKPIIEIAFACGYGSLSRFYDAFHQQLETTPRDYRQQFRK